MRNITNEEYVHHVEECIDRIKNTIGNYGIENFGKQTNESFCLSFFHSVYICAFISSVNEWLTIEGRIEEFETIKKALEMQIEAAKNGEGVSEIPLED